MKHREKLFKLLRECVETPQESFAVEEMIRKVSGAMLPIETVSDTRKRCNGFTFHKNNHGRFVGSIGLHRFVWTYFNGEIPDGCEIHHRDFDKENNDIANLELVTKDEHKRIHAECKNNTCFPKKSKFTCAVCGKKFQAVNRGNNAYCSAECKRTANHEHDKVERICLVCGQIFSTDKYKDAKCCSKKCAGKLLEKQETRICPTCGKEFSTCASGVRKFCSMQCFSESIRKSETRQCLHCGKEFSTFINGSQKFCSRECFYNSRRKRENKVCPICGKVFTAYPSNERIYCSRECYAASKRR